MSKSDDQQEKKTNGESDAGIEEKPVEVKAAAVEKEKDAPAEEAKTEDAPAEEAKAEEAPAEEAKMEEAPAEEVKTEAVPAEEAKTEEEPLKKGFQPRSKTSQKPTECASCGKAFAKKIWYYRNDAFYCNKKCYLTKSEADKQKAEEDKKKAEEAAAKE